MGDPTSNQPAIRALFEVNARLGDLVNWIEAAPYLMASEDQTVDVGLEILTRLRATRALGLKHMAALAQAAGVPSPAVMAALAASVEAGSPKDRP